jgi:hypothetical protein
MDVEVHREFGQLRVTQARQVPLSSSRLTGKASFWFDSEDVADELVSNGRLDLMKAIAAGELIKVPSVEAAANEYCLSTVDKAYDKIAGHDDLHWNGYDKLADMVNGQRREGRVFWMGE